MSKVSFRARALDATKPMPVFRANELPDLPDFANINRSVPQMPTGMEKEEESEHHLQQALTAQVVYGSSERLVIPIPEVIEVEETYNRLYKPDFKPTKQYIHVQAYGMDQEIPDYDLDSEDESWLNEQSKKMELTPEKFEEMMDRLEKGSGQQVMKLQEAKSLLKEDDDLTMAVYDYWLNKRLRLQQPLIPQVKTEKRDGSTTNNPYVAFRRRTEKMQTRKNRKNDEASYEKMLKLRRDITKAVTLLEMIKRREKSKKEILQLTIEILEKRYQMGDYSGQLVAEAEAERKKHPSFIPPFSFNRHGEAISSINGEEVPPVRKKRAYRRRNKQQQPQQLVIPQIPGPYSEVDVLHPDLDSSEEDGLSQGLSTSEHEDENDPDGPYAFRRKRHCSYHAPRFSRLGNWPWTSPEEGGLGERKYRYSLMTLPQKPRSIGFARRRVGRGGRVVIDRAATPWDEMLTQLDLTKPSASGDSGIMSEYKVFIRERKIPHFQCYTPAVEEEMEVDTRSCNSTPLPELTIERFESHQKQIRQMQQEQEEKLRRQESRELEGLPGFSGIELSSSSAPSPQLLLDTAKAEFAASALLQTYMSADSVGVEGNGLSQSRPSSTNCSLAPSSGPPTPLTPSTLTTLPAALTNGPLATENKSSALSTSPAANVLQLNFPISSATSSSSCASTPTLALLQASSPALSSPSSSTSLPHTSQIASLPSSMSSPIVNNRVIASNNSNVYKFSTTPGALELLRQNHDDSTSVHTFNKTEKTVPMDVT